MSDDFLTRVLLAATPDNCDDLWWKEDEGAVRIFVQCNDFFWWGCADVEEVTPENVGVLKEAYRDADLDGGLLFCARVRGLRPQGACYKLIDWEHRHLFDAAGPVRGIDLGNPYTPEGKYLYGADALPGRETP